MPTKKPRVTTDFQRSWKFRMLPFWQRVVAQTQKMPNGCELFMGCRTEFGYGRLRREDGKVVYLHREVWEKHNGPAPKGMVIMHKCDTPNCINLEHLQLGTHGDNLRDMHAKGRNNQPKGQSHPRSRLTENQVREIRMRRQAGESCLKLAMEFDVSEVAISHIATRRIWKSVQ